MSGLGNTLKAGLWGVLRALPLLGGLAVLALLIECPQTAALMPVSPTSRPLKRRLSHAWPETV